MSTKPIQNTDIASPDVYTKLITETKELLEIYKTLDVELTKVVKNVAKVSQGYKSNVAGDIQKAAAAEKQLTQAMLDSEKIKRAKIQTEKSLISLQQQKERATQREIKQRVDLKNAYTQESRTLNTLRNNYKNLAAQNKANTREAKLLLKEITRLDTKLKGIDKTVGQSQRNVGNYTSALNGLRNTGMKVTNMLGQLGLAVGAGMVFQDGIKTLIDFDERLADIAKTTGLSVDSARALSNELLKIDTRTSVDGLQQLAVAAGRLGIQGKQNIIDFVNAADKSFVALGDDLGGTEDEIATSLGKISAVFGDEAKFGVGEAILKTGSALNELSANSKASAGNILDFTNRMAGVASVAGIAQTDIQALGAFFDDAGQSIEVAATTLNVLLPELSKDQERFAKVAGLTAEEFGLMLKNAPIEALKAVAIGAKSSEGGLNGLVQTLEGFGIEAARGTAIVGTLAGGVDELTRLQEISNVAFAEGTSLTNEFNIKNQTTGALLEKLKKEWYKQILGIGGSTAASEKFRGALTFLIKNLGTILDVAFKLGKAFLVYKTTLLAVNTATKVSNTLNAIRTNGLKAMFVSQTALNTATDKGTKAVKGFNTATKANIIGVVITLIYGLVEAVGLLTEKTEGSMKAIEDETKAMEESNKQISESIRLREELAGVQKTIQSQLNQITKISDTQLLNLKDEIENTKGLISQLSIEEIKEQNLLSDEQIKQLAEVRAEGQKLLELQKELESSQQVELEKTNLAFNEKLKLTSETTNQQEKIIQGVNDEFTLKKNIIDLEKTANKEKQQSFEEFQNSKEKQDLIDAKILANNIKQDNIIKSIKNNEELMTAEQKEQLRLVNEEIKRRKLRSGGSSSGGEIPLTGLAKLQKELSDLEKKRSDLLVKNGGEIDKQFISLTNQSNELKNQIDAYKLVLENVEKIERAKAKGLQIDTQRGKSTLATGDVDLTQIGTSRGKTAEELKAELDSLKQLSEQFTNFTIMLIDRRIEALDRENEAQQRNYDEAKSREQELIELRKAGVVNLEESIAFEREAQAKALQEQEKIAKKKQRLELTNSAIQMFNAAVQQGGANPLGKTIADVTALVGFIRTLPTFWTGTDSTVGDALGIKYSNGRDGVLARVDASEMILNKSKVDTLKGYGITTTDGIIDAIEMQKFSPKSTNMTSPIVYNDNSEVIKELQGHKQLLQQIANKPVVQNDIEHFDKMIKISQTITTPKKVQTITKNTRIR